MYTDVDRCVIVQLFILLMRNIYSEIIYSYMQTAASNFEGRNTVRKIDRNDDGINRF